MYIRSKFEFNSDRDDVKIKIYSDTRRWSFSVNQESFQALRDDFLTYERDKTQVIKGEYIEFSEYIMILGDYDNCLEEDINNFMTDLGRMLELIEPIFAQK